MCIYYSRWINSPDIFSSIKQNTQMLPLLLFSNCSIFSQRGTGCWRRTMLALWRSPCQPLSVGQWKEAVRAGCRRGWTEELISLREARIRWVSLYAREPSLHKLPHWCPTAALWGSCSLPEEAWAGGAACTVHGPGFQPARLPDPRASMLFTSFDKAMLGTPSH